MVAFNLAQSRAVQFGTNAGSVSLRAVIGTGAKGDRGDVGPSGPAGGPLPGQHDALTAGADPTGATDSTAIIQAQIDAVGSAVLPATPTSDGFYRCDGTLDISAGTLTIMPGADLRRTLDSPNTDPLILLHGNNARLDLRGSITMNNNTPRGIVRLGPTTPTKVYYGATTVAGTPTVTIPDSSGDTFTADDRGKTISLSPNSVKFSGILLQVTTIADVAEDGLSATLAVNANTSSTNNAIFWGVEESDVWARVKGGGVIKGAWMSGTDATVTNGSTTLTTVGAVWGPQHEGWSVRIQQTDAVVTGTDGAITADPVSGLLTVFTSASSTFTGTQVGERITVAGAGVGGVPLRTIVVDVPDAHTLTLQIPATSAVINAGWTLGGTLHSKIASVISPTQVELADATSIDASGATWSAAPAVGIYLDSSPQGSTGGEFSAGIESIVIRGVGDGIRATCQANAWGTSGVDYYHIIDHCVRVVDTSSVSIHGGFVHQSPDVTCLAVEKSQFFIVSALKAEPGGNSVPLTVDDNSTRVDVWMTPNTFSAPLISAKAPRVKFRSAGAPSDDRQRFASTFGLEPVVAANAGGGNRVLDVANDAIVVAMQLPYNLLINKLTWCTGAAVSGNYDVGLYDIEGNKLWSKGSTAWSALATQTAQAVTVSPSVQVWAGQTFYVVFAGDNITGQFKGNANTPFPMQAAIQRIDGKFVCLRSASSFPLPASLPAILANSPTETKAVPFIVLGGTSSIYG